MSRRRLITRSIIAVPVLLLMFVVGSCGFDFVTNNRHLNQMKHSLATLPLPPQTEQLATRSAVGLLSGNGNHCDFFVGTIFRSNLSPDSIRQHFAESTFFNPVTAKRESVEITILTDTESMNRAWLPDGLESVESWRLSPAMLSSGTVFLVSIFRSYEANNDCRCT